MRHCCVLLWGLVLQLTVWWLTHRVDCVRLCNKDGLDERSEPHFTKLAEGVPQVNHACSAEVTKSLDSKIPIEDDHVSVTHVSHTFKPPPGLKITHLDTSGQQDSKVMPLGSSKFSPMLSHTEVDTGNHGKNFARPPAMSETTRRPSSARISSDKESIPSDQKREVIISPDLLTNLVKGSPVPPSGPSRDHNWETSSALPSTRTSSDNRANSKALFFRIERIDAPHDDKGVIDLPSPQEVGDSFTYRILM